MKAQRRHELKENELAIQIELLQDYLRRNGTKIMAVATALVVVAAAVMYVVNSRAATRQQALRLLGMGPEKPAETTEGKMAPYKELADQNLDPVITATALKSAADVALNAMNEALDKGDKTGAARWADEARKLYSRVRELFDNVPGVGIAARFSLADIAEDTGAFAEAEGIYQGIVADPQFRLTPYVGQARYRLDHLKDWGKPVKFAASQPAIVSTAPSTAPAAMPAATQVIPTATQPLTIPPTASPETPPPADSGS